MNRKEKVIIFFSWLMLGGIVVLAIINLTATMTREDLATMSSRNIPLAEKIAMAQEKLAENPEDFQALMVIVDSYVEGNQLFEAMSLLKRAEQLQPMSVHVQSDLGVVYQRTGQYDLAIEKYRAALKIDPDDLNSLYHMGIIYRDDKNDNRAAMEVFEKILAKNPSPRISEMINKEINQIKAGQTDN